ncbi:MAG: WYL domain-containing protein [Candidatus Cloacimonetes bacterium]|nr:WYL domain-containing protein [Candidatus Cloacimonadota bacterium]
MTQTEKLPWSAEQRLRFIEFRLFWYGSLNRADLMNTFDIAIAQASKDLSYYQIVAPKNMDYDKSAKVYRRSKEFEPRFYQPDAEQYLSMLHMDSEEVTNNWMPYVPLIDSLPVPMRRVDVRILRDVVSAIRQNKVLRINYQSMSKNRPEAQIRQISPHAMATDGMRWHVRAYCHIDHKFKDFLLSRLLECEVLNEDGYSALEDHIWQEHFEVVLKPNPELSEEQQAMIAKDYYMQNGILKISIRNALLYYFQKRLRLDVAKFLKVPQEQPLVLVNEAEFEKALQGANY